MLVKVQSQCPCGVGGGWRADWSGVVGDQGAEPVGVGGGQRAEPISVGGGRKALLVWASYIPV